MRGVAADPQSVDGRPARINPSDGSAGIYPTAQEARAALLRSQPAPARGALFVEARRLPVKSQPVV
jgi:hypothetical protein